jgi:hypothetical protein
MLCVPGGPPSPLTVLSPLHPHCHSLARLPRPLSLSLLLQALSDYVRRFTAEHALDKGAPPTVATVAKLFRSLAYENKDRLMAGLIVAGWDPVDGGAVWEIPLGGACIKQPFSIGAWAGRAASAAVMAGRR